jgi:hypothetical protein
MGCRGGGSDCRRRSDGGESSLRLETKQLVVDGELLLKGEDCLIVVRILEGLVEGPLEVFSEIAGKKNGQPNEIPWGDGLLRQKP